MHGLHADLDLSVFCGATLDLITFTSNTIHFAFDKPASVTIQSSYKYYANQTSAFEQNKVPPRESRLMQLVGQSVHAASPVGRGTLLLEFESGQRLEIFDDYEQYESYLLTIGDREVFV